MKTLLKGIALITPTTVLSMLFLFATPEGSRVHDLSWLFLEILALMIVAITSLSFLLAIITLTLIGFRFILGLQIRVPNSKITENTND